MGRLPARTSLFLACAILAGCQQAAPTLDASSSETLDTSLSHLLAAASPEAGPGLELAVADIRRDFIGTEPGENKPAGIPAAVLHGYTAEDLLRFHARYYPSAEAWPEESPEFDHALRHRLINLYQLDADSLAIRRESVHAQFLITPDKVPVLDFVLIPPSSSAPIDADLARFVVKLRNDGTFPIYSPSFRVKISAPDALFPAFDRTFVLKALDPPIEPGQSRQLSFSCCSVLHDPISNRAMKNLPDLSKLEVSIVSALDFEKKELLDLTTYTLADARREEHLRHCIDLLDRTEASQMVSAGPCLNPIPADPDRAHHLADSDGEAPAAGQGGA